MKTTEGVFCLNKSMVSCSSADSLALAKAVFPPEGSSACSRDQGTGSQLNKLAADVAQSSDYHKAAAKEPHQT